MLPFKTSILNLVPLLWIHSHAKISVNIEVFYFLSLLSETFIAKPYFFLPSNISNFLWSKYCSVLLYKVLFLRNVCPTNFHFDQVGRKSVALKQKLWINSKNSMPKYKRWEVNLPLQDINWLWFENFHSCASAIHFDAKRCLKLVLEAIEKVCNPQYVRAQGLMIRVNRKV